MIKVMIKKIYHTRNKPEPFTSMGDILPHGSNLIFLLQNKNYNYYSSNPKKHECVHKSLIKK